MEKLHQIIKENLEKKYQLNESFEKIFLSEDDYDKIGHAINFYDQLIEEGYDEDEMTGIIDEQMEWFQSLFSSNKETPQDIATHKSAVNTGGRAGFSQFKTYLIKSFLKMLGFEGPMASAIATAMTEMSIADIIAVFRSREGCISHSGDVAGGIIEAIAMYIVQGNARKDSIVYNYLVNLSREMLRNSGYDKQVGQFICNYAYKVRQKAMPNKPKTI